MTQNEITRAVNAMETALREIRCIPQYERARLSGDGASVDLAQIKIQEALWWTKELIDD